MRGERFIQYAAALAIITLWGVLQILDARSETYGVPSGVTYIAFAAAGFVFGFDKVAKLVPWARRSDEPERPPTPKETSTDA